MHSPGGTIFPPRHPHPPDLHHHTVVQQNGSEVERRIAHWLRTFATFLVTSFIGRVLAHNRSLDDCLGVGQNAASPKIPKHLIGDGGANVIQEMPKPNLIQKSAIYVVMTKRRSRVTKSPSPDLLQRGERVQGESGGVQWKSWIFQVLFE